MNRQPGTLQIYPGRPAQVRRELCPTIRYDPLMAPSRGVGLIDVRQRLVATDRVMVLAPHRTTSPSRPGRAPAGGLVGRAQIRVIVPDRWREQSWAQRATEEVAHLGGGSGSLGSRRRREALDALECLWCAASEAPISGFPDQRVTEASSAGRTPRSSGLRRKSRDGADGALHAVPRGPASRS